MMRFSNRVKKISHQILVATTIVLAGGRAAIAAEGASESKPTPHLLFALHDPEAPHAKELAECEKLTLQGYRDHGTRVTEISHVDENKRLLYFRFDGTAWKTTYLAKAGTKLYADEQDYTGLGALVPDDPTTIYISTPFDPRDDTTKSAKREIWRGTTCDKGATFKWTPVTANSTKDNIRPIVPKWDASHTALLWMQGTYSTAQSYNMAIVGTVTKP